MSVLFFMYCRFVSVQVCDTPGNVVIVCQNGRTRAPMYLVVYLMICHDLTHVDALDIVVNELFSQRGLELDRHDSLKPVLEYI